MLDAVKPAVFAAVKATQVTRLDQTVSINFLSFVEHYAYLVSVCRDSLYEVSELIRDVQLVSIKH
jgi:hypothetical protein